MAVESDRAARVCPRPEHATGARKPSFWLLSALSSRLSRIEQFRVPEAVLTAYS
jgi:hypothetical protein